MRKQINFKALLSILFLCPLLIPATYELRGSTATVEFLTKIFGKNVAIANSSGCSEYIENATINEVHESGAQDYFIEIKIIDYNNIDNSTIENWTISFSSKKEGSRTVQLNDNNVNWSGYPWIVIPEESIEDKDYIQLKKGMEILLEDSSGRDIDYLNVAEYSNNLSPECTDFAYDTDMNSTNSHTIFRDPDGTGPWRDAGPGASGEPTRGGRNVGDIQASNFDVFESFTEEGSTEGPLYTKVSSKEFKVSVVALNEGELVNFSGNVDLEIVDPKSGSECESLDVIKEELGSDAFSNEKRITVEGLSYSNAIEEAQIRIDPEPAHADKACSTDTFTIRPAYLTLNATDDDWEHPGTIRIMNGDNSDTCQGVGGSEACHKAGRDFTLHGTAYNSENTSVNGYNATADVGWELNAPSGGRLGPSREPNSVDFDGSRFRTDNATYSEVGLVDISLNDQGNFTAQSGDKADHCVSGSSSNTQNSDGKYGCQTATQQNQTVGRFVPDHFKLHELNLLIDHRSHYTSCPTNFTYLDEQWSFDFKLTAKSYNNYTTQNYIGNFTKLNITNNSTYDGTNSSGLNYAAVQNPNNSTTQTSPKSLTDRLEIKITDSSESFTNGTAGNATIKLDGIVSRNSTLGPDGPFDDFRFGFKPIDEDGVTLLGSPNLDSTLSGTSDTYELAKNDDGELRYGRLILENAYGSELQDLKVPIRAQYYDGSGFILNEDDQCTQLTIGNGTDIVKMELKNDDVDWQSANQTIELSGRQSNGTTEGIALRNAADNATTLNLDKGEAFLLLEAPGQDNTGYVHVRTNLEDHPWLQHDWSGNGDYTNNPNATATFGIYKGNEHIIYQQETTWQ